MGLLRIIQTCLMNRRTTKILLVIFALLAFAAMLYHTYNVIKPFDATPVWRHSLFIGINMICIYGLLKRPDWFIWFFGILTLQQLYSHGSHFIRLLTESKFTWIDFCVLLLMPIGFILLLFDKKSTRDT
jgi:hypothetical protein